MTIPDEGQYKGCCWDGKEEANGASLLLVYWGVLLGGKEKERHYPFCLLRGQKERLACHLPGWGV